MIIVKDVLSVSVFKCTVEHIFSILRRISIRQRHQLNTDTISAFMLYKYAITKTDDPLYMNKPTHNEDMKYMISKTEKDIPEEWVQN